MTRPWFRVVGLALLVLVLAPGCILVDVKIPLDTDLHETDLGNKTGESSMQSVLWLVAWGDAGTQAAAREGRIKTLKHADQKVFSLLGGVYSKRTTVVYGD